MDLESLRALKPCAVFVLNLLWRIGVLQLPSFAAAAVTADDALGMCQEVALPNDIRQTLQRRFAAWRIQDSRELLPQARQRWAQSTPLACPGIASGHYEDARSVSYALLLVPVDKTGQGYQLIVFSAPPRQTFYGYKLLEQAETDANAVFIRSPSVEQVFTRALQKQLRPKGGDVVLRVHVDNRTAFQDAFYWKGDSYDHTEVDF